MAHALDERLAREPLLCDGAMGTLLYARGVPLDACFDELNMNNPALVQAIHAEYIAAGADCIETNTFGANRFKLAIHGLEARVREINLRGVKLARDVRESWRRWEPSPRARRAPRSASRRKASSRGAWTGSSSKRCRTWARWRSPWRRSGP